MNRFFDPIVAPMRYLPITAFIPLLILWFGIDESQKIAFLFLGTVVFLLAGGGRRDARGARRAGADRLHPGRDASCR